MCVCVCIGICCVCNVRVCMCLWFEDGRQTVMSKHGTSNETTLKLGGWARSQEADE